MTDQRPNEEGALRVGWTFAAARDEVFRAWTDPEQLKRWWGAEGYSTPRASVQLRVGGGYRVTMKPPEGGLVHVAGTYTEVRQPERLVFTWVSDGSHSQGKAIVEFHDRDGATEVVLTHDLEVGEEIRAFYEHAWQRCCDRLAQVLDAGGDRPESTNGNAGR